jgi:hypothetical protein
MIVYLTLAMQSINWTIRNTPIVCTAQILSDAISGVHEVVLSRPTGLSGKYKDTAEFNKLRDKIP